MKITSIVNLKGGTGKTTTSVAMIELLSRKGRVLAIDNDKQGNLSQAFKKYTPERMIGSSVMLLTGKAKGNIMLTDNPCIDIIPCNIYMEQAEKEVLLGNVAQHDRYQKALSELVGYERCIIDNPPDIGMNVINALIASDEIIIPINLDNYSLDGMIEMMNQIQNITEINRKANLTGILITDFEKTEAALQAEEWLRKEYGKRIFSIKIRHSRQAKDATLCQVPVTQYSSRCGATQDYKKFVEEYLRRER